MKFWLRHLGFLTQLDVRQTSRVIIQVGTLTQKMRGLQVGLRMWMEEVREAGKTI